MRAHGVSLSEVLSRAEERWSLICWPGPGLEETAEAPRSQRLHAAPGSITSGSRRVPVSVVSARYRAKKGKELDG